jgi:hypothetical protein
VGSEKKIEYKTDLAKMSMCVTILAKSSGRVIPSSVPLLLSAELPVEIRPVF